MRRQTFRQYGTPCNTTTMRLSLRYVLLPALVGIFVGGLVTLWMNNGGGGSGYADAVGRAAPSVVNIYSSKSVQPPICNLPRYREWCERFRDRTRQQSSLGSGVVVHPDGFVLTNDHVISEADEILVAFNNGQSTSAAVIGRDPETDLAVIKVQARDLPAIAIASSEDVAVGDIALAIGNPFGIGQTVSQGIISAKSRAGVSASPYDDFIQTDAAINPGNSGGALIDEHGALIGINTMIFSRSGGSQGIGFAIPSDLALNVLTQIVENGRVRRGWLGVEVTAQAAGQEGMGLPIARVLPGGPAAEAGLRGNDTIIAIDGIPVSDTAGFSRIVADYGPGERLQLVIDRAGAVYEVEVVSGERPPS